MTAAHNANGAQVSAIAAQPQREAAPGRPGPEGLFSGPFSIRVANEARALALSILAAPLAIVLIGTFFHGITVSEVALLVVVGLVLVSLARGRLLGGSVRINERQFPDVFTDVGEIAGRLGVAVPLVFVRDDPFVPLTSVGTEEPYALVISSQYFEHLRRPELRFLIARELAHIAAGHTRIQSIFSASGRENPFISILFGSWLRKTEYTADRAGLLFTESIDDATSAIAITTFHAIGRRIDYEALAEQQAALEDDGRLRMGEWSSAVPFATNRLKALAAFASSPLAENWKRELARAERVADGARFASHGEFVTKRDCASPLRRMLSIALDVSVVAAILNSGLAVTLSPSNKALTASEDADMKWLLDTFPGLAKLTHANLSLGSPEVLLVFFVYSALLVALSGQTLGMMITELRVVTPRFERPGIAQSIWRYVAGALSSLVVIPALVGLVMRIQPHDRLSRTRVVRSRLLR